jgi:hypothetical protein
MVFDPSFMNNGIVLLAGFGGAFLIILWISLIFWTYRDIRSRTRDPLLRILATLVSLLLFLPGLIIYLILRPNRTLEDEYTRTLEEEALLQSVEVNVLCPGCNRRIQDEWIVCPSCHTRLKQTCPNCGHGVQLSWDICPYCANQVSPHASKVPLGDTKDLNTADSFQSGII